MDGRTAEPGGETSQRPVRADARRNRARILEAAEEVFAERGASAPTEAVAERAGVAIGTVFRHFPTKPELLRAVVMALWDRLVEAVGALVEDAEADAALLDLCDHVVVASVRNRAVFARLAETGTRVDVAEALQRLRPAVDTLLERAQQAGVAREDLRTDELLALLGALCQEAVAADWSERFCRRSLAIVFEGVRPEPPS